jgi:beta-phosphoglucomutase-like phosphatase (HAD superfamily)
MSGSATAVLFDVDGTLVDSDDLPRVCWRAADTTAGQDVPASRIHRASGTGSDQRLGARPDSPIGQ